MSSTNFSFSAFDFLLSWLGFTKACSGFFEFLFILSNRLRSLTLESMVNLKLLEESFPVFLTTVDDAEEPIEEVALDEAVGFVAEVEAFVDDDEGEFSARNAGALGFSSTEELPRSVDEGEAGFLIKRSLPAKRIPNFSRRFTTDCAESFRFSFNALPKEVNRAPAEVRKALLADLTPETTVVAPFFMPADVD